MRVREDDEEKPQKSLSIFYNKVFPPLTAEELLHCNGEFYVSMVYCVASTDEMNSKRVMISVGNPIGNKTDVTQAFLFISLVSLGSSDLWTLDSSKPSNENFDVENLSWH